MSNELEKVERLMRLALDEATTPHEASTAALQAVRMIKKYELRVVLGPAKPQPSVQRNPAPQPRTSGPVYADVVDFGTEGFRNTADFHKTMEDYLRDMMAGFAHGRVRDPFAPPQSTEEKAHEEQARKEKRAREEAEEHDRRTRQAADIDAACKRDRERTEKQQKLDAKPLPPGGCYATHNEPGRPSKCSACGRVVMLGERYWRSPQAEVWCLVHPMIAAAWYPPQNGDWREPAYKWKCSCPGCQDPHGQYIRGTWAYSQYESDQADSLRPHFCEVCVIRPADWKPRANQGPKEPYGP